MLLAFQLLAYLFDNCSTLHFRKVLKNGRKRNISIKTVKTASQKYEINQCDVKGNEQLQSI